MSELGEPRKRRRIKIRVDLHEWIDEQVQNGKFQNFSHAIETALEKLRDTETQTNQPNNQHPTTNK
jgi:Arc/MetJ-type ribon-helix-helix transcriptional regulator